MLKGLIGKKIGMTQIFDEQGVAYPVTIIEAGPCYVTQVRNQERDGYVAVQLGFGEIHPKKLAAGELGHLKANDLPPMRFLREFRSKEAVNVGDKLTVDLFAVGEHVDVVGTSKGKGFAGVVKRYHWHGADMTHGSMIHRKPQSAGATDAARIFKNTGRPGHMGHERVTVKRLRVVRTIPEKNVLLIRGAVPGPNGGLLTIREAKP